MGLGTYLAGVVWSVLTIGPVAIAAWLVLRSRFAHLEGAERVLAYGLLLTTGLIVAMLVPGALGILSRGTATVASLMILAAAARLAPGGRAVPARIDRLRSIAGDGRLVRVIVAVTLFAVATYLAAFFFDRFDRPVTQVDALSYGLPTVARWIQTGTVWPVPHFVPLWGFGNYPQHGELLQLAVVLPWHGTQLVRLLGIAYLLLAGVATYGLATELGGPRLAAASWAAGSIVIPATFLPAAQWAKTDVILLAGFTTGVVFLARHARTGSVGDLVLAALGFGLSFGTKWYGVSYAPLLLVGWAAVRLYARDGRRRVGLDFVLVGGATVVTGGFWLVRNLVESSNPFFPVKVSVLGATLFDAPPDYNRSHFGFSLLHYATAPHAWSKYILPTMRHSFALMGALAALALVVAVAMRAIRGAKEVPGRVLAVALGGIAVWIAYAATPYTAQGPSGKPLLVVANVRYASPALALGAAVGAWLTGRSRRFAPALLALVAVATVESVRQIAPVGIAPELHAIAAGRRLAPAALVVLLAIAAYAVVRRRTLSQARPVALAAGAAAVVAAGYLQAHRFFQADSYDVDPPLGWVDANAPTGHRIGIAGPAVVRKVTPTLPLAGPRLGNHVQWMGPVVRGFLHDLPGRAAFDGELDRERYDIVYVFRPGPGKPAPADSWAAARGLRPVARDPFATLYVDPRASR